MKVEKLSIFTHGRVLSCSSSEDRKILMSRNIGEFLLSTCILSAFIVTGQNTREDLETQVESSGQVGSVDFYRNWTDYQTGFGQPSGEFWLGMELGVPHVMCNTNLK